MSLNPSSRHPNFDTCARLIVLLIVFCLLLLIMLEIRPFEAALIQSDMSQATTEKKQEQADSSNEPVSEHTAAQAPTNELTPREPAESKPISQQQNSTEQTVFTSPQQNNQTYYLPFEFATLSAGDAVQFHHPETSETLTGVIDHASDPINGESVILSGHIPATYEQTTAKFTLIHDPEISTLVLHQKATSWQVRIDNASGSVISSEEQIAEDAVSLDGDTSQDSALTEITEEIPPNLPSPTRSRESFPLN